MKNSSPSGCRTTALFVYFIAFLFSINSYSQTPQYYNLNNGTSSNGFPFAQTSGKAVNTLFLPGAFGIPSGRQITTVYFRMATAGTRTYTDLRILMAQDTITNLTSTTLYSGPYDTVYYNASVSFTSTVGGWMAITLNKPFYYDTSKSLILFVGQCGSTGSGGNVYNTTLTGLKRTWSTGGCPYAVTSAGDAATLNFGMDVTTALSGTYTIPGGCFRTISSAVNAINRCGLSGAVKFNVLAGYSENTTSPILLTGTGTSVNKITFQKYGTGLNPVVNRTDTGTVYTTVAGGQGDGVIVIQGSDYATFNGINVTASSSQIEYGYYLRKANTDDGCKYDSIKNSAVTLTKGTGPYVIGIYSSNNDSSSTGSSATGITLTSTGGRNENVYITGDTISNVHSGIVIRGYNHTASPYDFYDQNMTVGISGAGNLIRNFGGGSATASYGVYLIYQTSPVVSYNTINNASGGTDATSTLYGIFMSTSSAGGNYVSSYNTITLGQSSTSGAHCIYNAQTCTSINISYNTFSYGTFASTTASYMINCNNATPAITANYNKTSGIINKSGVGTLYGYYNYGSPSSGTTTINYNSFSNINLTGTSVFYGLYSATSTTQVFNINYNAVKYITAGSGSIYGIYAGYGATGNTITGDTVYSIYNSGLIYGIYSGAASASTSLSVNGNVVNTLSTTGASVIYGIYQYYGTANSIYRNRIYNLSASNASGTVYGITVANSTASASNYIYNNFLSDLKTPAGNSAIPLAGIYISTSTATVTTNLFYNTVYLDATSTGTNFGSSCVYANTGSSLDMRNNILVNASTAAGTGLTTAYRRNSSTLTTYSGTSDNNCFYAGAPGVSNLLYYDGTNSIQNIAGFRTLVSPRDASSFTELPPFINKTATPYNLHLNTTDTTQCEKGGIPVSSPISVTNDYDNGTRNATYPDVGADEFSGIPDFPNIAFTNLPNTASTSNYVTSGWATIRDISGINVTSGTAPRLYYKKSSNTNELNDNTSATNGWKWVETSSLTNPYDFTIDYSKLYGGTASFGDRILYFVVAQDILGIPKVSSKTCTFAVSPSGVNLTSAQFPVTGSISNFMITNSNPLSGEYSVSLSLFNKITGKNLESKEFTRKVIRDIPIETDNILKNEKEKTDNSITENILKTEKVEIEEKYYALSENGIKYTGPTYIEFTPEIRKEYNLTDNYIGNYANISSAIGDLNAAGISSSVTFNLLDANYGDAGTPEDFPITINSVAGAGPGATITIKPSTVTPLISGSSSTSIFKLDGADYVIINGSNSGSTDRSLTIENTKASTGTAAIWLVSGSAVNTGATNNIIKNCNIKTGTNTTTTYGIAMTGSTFATAAYDNDNNTIQNNYIYKTYSAIYSSNNASAPSDNLIITGNILGAPIGTSTDYLGYFGIYETNTNGSVINQNVIQNMISTVTSKKGIYLYTGVTNAVVSNNKINSIQYTGTGGWGARGIDITTSNVSSNIQVFNNIIYDIIGDGDPSSYSYMPIGIAIDGTTGGVGVYNNSVYLYGDAYNGGSSYVGLYSCIFVGSSALSLDIRNNILMNTIYKTSIAGAKSYALFTAGTNAAFTSINYNDYYVSGANGVLCYLSADVTTLSGWKTATAQDQFSINTNPGFVSTTDLSINTSISGCWCLNGGAYPISSVTGDYDGNSRSSALNTGSTDIGAYEFTPSVSSPALTVSGAISDGSTSTISFAGLTLAAITWHSGAGTLPSSINPVFYPQVNPPNPTGNYANENFVITATGGSGFTYDITYNYNLARLYTISSESEMRLAKYNASTGWEQYDAAPNTTAKSITVTGVTSFSTFTFGDNSSPLPVKMKSFSSSISGRNVKLTWVTESELNSKGFEIQRSKYHKNNYEKIAFINSKGKPNSMTEYNYNDNKLNSGKYEYRLKQSDFNGNYTYFNLSSCIEVGLPDKFSLSQNYPNPFNPVTKIDFELPFDSKVKIVLYDILGREVKVLVPNELKQAGFYTLEINALNLASGTYFYRMVANSRNKDFVFTKKMVVVK